MLKRGFVFLSCLIFWVASFAAKPVKTSQGIKLDLQLEVGGKLLSSPQTYVPDGETGIVEQKIKDQTAFYSFEIVPTRVKGNEVLMMLTVNKITDGKSVYLGSPILTTANGEPTILEQESDELPAIKVTITPHF